MPLDVLATMKKMTKAEGKKDRVPKKPPAGKLPTDNAPMLREKAPGIDSAKTWQQGDVATVDSGKRTKQPPTHNTDSPHTNGR